MKETMRLAYAASPYWFANETDVLSDAVRQAKSQRSYAKPDKQAKKKGEELERDNETCICC